MPPAPTHQPALARLCLSLVLLALLVLPVGRTAKEAPLARSQSQSVQRVAELVTPAPGILSKAGVRKGSPLWLLQDLPPAEETAHGAALSFGRVLFSRVAEHAEAAVPGTARGRAPPRSSRLL